MRARFFPLGCALDAGDARVLRAHRLPFARRFIRFKRR